MMNTTRTFTVRTSRLQAVPGTHPNTRWADAVTSERSFRTIQGARNHALRLVREAAAKDEAAGYVAENTIEAWASSRVECERRWVARDFADPEALIGARALSVRVPAWNREPTSALTIEILPA